MAKSNTKAKERRLQIEYVPLGQLKLWDQNPRKNEEAAKRLVGIIESFGFLSPIIAQRSNMTIRAGHTRYKAEKLRAQKAGENWRLREVPVIFVEFASDDEAAMFAIADNKASELAEWDREALARIFSQLPKMDKADVATRTGFAQADISALLLPTDGAKQADASTKAKRATLAEEFIAPPFTVLDTRQDFWPQRRDAWLSLGIRPELARREALAKFSKSVFGGNSSGVVFDPVLCELMYQWFCPQKGAVLDPFAGGAVRGIVAAWLQRNYLGIDLSKKQVADNKEQWDKLREESRGSKFGTAKWLAGDALETISQVPKESRADFIFTAPPLFNLELYSNDPRDLSNMPWDKFIASYREIVKLACDKLADNRFAAIVVSEIRSSLAGAGRYIGFVPQTIRAFEDAGLRYYNEAVLVTSLGSLPLRARTQMASTRKLGRVHQTVLIFVKGSPSRATEACGKINLMKPESFPTGNWLSATDKLGGHGLASEEPFDKTTTPKKPVAKRKG